MTKINDILNFTKMEGAGNDYIYIDCVRRDEVNLDKDTIIRLSDRHFGIGSDGVVKICKSNIADFKMKMYNSDGSESEMCGNATRCIGKYVYDNKMTFKKEITLETLSGIKTLKLYVNEQNKVEKVTVDMGRPVLKGLDIPVAIDKETVISEEILVSGKAYSITCVSMGNPHAVIFCDNITDMNIEDLGREIEHHKIFPRRTNVEFAKVTDSSHIVLRVWERGAGETLACGTGTCATVVASVLNGLTEREVDVKLRGGILHIKWDKENDHIYMTGPARTVFEGEIEI